MSQNRGKNDPGARLFQAEMELSGLHVFHTGIYLFPRPGKQYSLLLGEDGKK